MVTFLVLLLAIIIIAMIAVLFVGTGGITVLLIFGDVIIAGLIIYGIIRAILKRK